MEILFIPGIAFATFMPLILTVLLTRVGAHSGSFRRRAGPPRWVFSPPSAFAAAGVTFLLGIALMVLFSLSRDTIFGTTHRGIDLIPNGPLPVALGLIALTYWGAARVLRRMCALTLDSERRTYRRVDISGVFLKAQTGTWEDIAGVCVRRSKTARGNNTFAYYVALQWRSGNTGVYSILGGFGERDQADAYAQQIARDLLLPLAACVASI